MTVDVSQKEKISVGGKNGKKESVLLSLDEKRMRAAQTLKRAGRIV